MIVAQPVGRSRWHQMRRRKPIDEAVRDADRTGLRRRLGAGSLLVLGVANILGAGVFVMTGAAAADFAGPGVMLSFALSAFACAFTALCYAELASAIPVPGSAYSYCYATLGEGCAWALGWLVLLEYSLSASLVAVGFAGYFSSLLATLGTALPAAITTPLVAAAQHDGHTVLELGGGINLVAACAAMAAAVTLVFGVGRSALVNAILVIIKLGVLLAFIAIGASAVNPELWTPFVPPNEGGFSYGWPGVVRAAAMLFFAYLGFETVSMAAAEARDPRRDVPLGILGALALCALLYIAAAAVLTGLVPYRQLGVADPVALAVDRIGWPGFAGLIKIGALTGLASVLLANAYGQSRMCLAMARDGLLPPLFARVHPRYGTPWLGNLVLGAIAAGAAALLPIGVLGDLVCIGIAFAFILVCVAVMWVRSARPDLVGAFRVPFGGVRIGKVWLGTVPVLGIVLCVAMMAPVLLDMVVQVRRGDVLPASILALYCLAGAAIYWRYGLRAARRTENLV